MNTMSNENASASPFDTVVPSGCVEDRAGAFVQRSVVADNQFQRQKKAQRKSATN